MYGSLWWRWYYKVMKITLHVLTVCIKNKTKKFVRYTSKKCILRRWRYKRISYFCTNRIVIMSVWILCCALETPFLRAYICSISHILRGLYKVPCKAIHYNKDYQSPRKGVERRGPVRLSITTRITNAIHGIHIHPKPVRLSITTRITNFSPFFASVNIPVRLSITTRITNNATLARYVAFPVRLSITTRITNINVLVHCVHFPVRLSITTRITNLTCWVQFWSWPVRLSITTRITNGNIFLLSFPSPVRLSITTRITNYPIL